jgi:endogenous inhibitor of DNA gyrase (YacG/DUF329 family)
MPCNAGARLLRQHGVRMPERADSPAKNPTKIPAKPCPICGKPAAEQSRPFCSKRCADVDLNRWLSGAYVVPGKEDDDEDGTRSDEQHRDVTRP